MHLLMIRIAYCCWSEWSAEITGGRCGQKANLIDTGGGTRGARPPTRPPKMDGQKAASRSSMARETMGKRRLPVQQDCFGIGAMERKAKW